MSNKVIAQIPIGQTTQALVYVPNAVPSGGGTANLLPLGVAGNTARLQLVAASSSSPNAQGSAAVNSLGLLDLVQITAAGLAPLTQYDVFLAEHNDEPLAILMTNPDTAGTVQAIGPLKTLADNPAATEAPRFLIVMELNDPSNVVLLRSEAPSNAPSAGATPTPMGSPTPGASTSGP